MTIPFYSKLSSSLALGLLLSGCGSQFLAEEMSPADFYMQPINSKGDEIPASEAINAFVRSAYLGDVSALELALLTGIDVNAYASNGRTALMAASYSGHEACVECLLKAGAKTDIMAATGSQIRSYDRSIISVYIDFQELERRTALGYAAYKGHTSCIKLLLDAGADASSYSGDFLKLTALMDCAKLANLQGLNLLLAKGAKLEMMDERGVTALMFACRNPDGYDCVKRLIRAGAKVNHRSPGNHETPLTSAVSSGNERIFQLLIQHGAKLDKKEIRQQNLLVTAAEKENLQICQQLLHMGYDVNARNGHGQTALMLACQLPKGTASIPLIQVLLNAGADINAMENNKQTPLMYAILYKDDDQNNTILPYLLKHGANPWLTNFQGETALDYAIQRGVPSEAAILRKAMEQKK